MKRHLFLYQLMNVDRLRTLVARARWFYFVKLRKRLRFFDAKQASEGTVSHNVKGMVDLSVRRSLTLVRPLVAALTVSRPGGAVEAASFKGLRILSIGPRTEGELLNLVGHGFVPEQIRGLDLISYSPWVDLGDMHAMPYPDNSWDAIMFGWVLAYSDDKQRAADEIVRVAKNGAIIAVGVEYCCLSNDQIIAKYGYLSGSAERIWKLGDILQYFAGHIGQIYFQHDVTPARQHEEVVALIAVFSIKK